MHNGARLRGRHTHLEGKSGKETRALEELEMRIAKAETRKAELEKRMHDNSSDYVLIQELDVELQRLKVELERDMERWAELAEFS